MKTLTALSKKLLKLHFLGRNALKPVGKSLSKDEARIGVEHHKKGIGVLYAKETSVVLGTGAGEWCQINLHTSCDVLAPLNHLETTVVDGARSIFTPTVVSSPDQKHFHKNAPGTIIK
jgi:hypothetical protein